MGAMKDIAIARMLKTSTRELSKRAVTAAADQVID
jgi:hypothetical protein